MIPNADHGLRFCDPATCQSQDDFTSSRNDVYDGTRKFMEGTTTFHYAISHNIPRPTFDWRIDYRADDRSATITLIELSEEPLSVTAWRAVTKDGIRRDFRLVNCGKAADGVCASEDDVDVNPREYLQTSVLADGHGVWQSTAMAPRVGWAAFFLEVRIRAPASGLPDYRMTTEAIVVPDVYPFSDCESRSCTDSCGTLQLV